MKTHETAWKLTNIIFDRAPNGTDGRMQDRVELELMSEGDVYHVQVAASHTMQIHQLVNALRAATGYVLRGATGELPADMRIAEPGEAGKLN